MSGTTTRTPTELPGSAEEVLERVRALRPALVAMGPRIDAEGVDATEAMDLLAGSGAQAWHVPTRYGGLLEGGLLSGLDTHLSAWLEVAAADGSVGQLWGFLGIAIRMVLCEAQLPESTRSQVAHEVLHEGRRIGSTMSERGAAGPTTSRAVEGGIVVTGTKAFGTQSGAGEGTIVLIPHLLEGATAHVALIRTGNPGVELGYDWDAMGQRGTDSQTIRLHEVFVPDGWHHPHPGVTPEFLIAALSGHAALLQGIGEGALAATLEHVAGMDRASMPMFTSPSSDPMLHRRLGEMSSTLAASRALVLDLARAPLPPAPAHGGALLVAVLRADHAACRAALAVTSGLFDLTGARSTAAGLRLDRFWRNARTMACHHSRDANAAMIGSYLMNGTLPPLIDYVKL
jgi:alkylation response protein AidB-like acyl-CoA dehydrogenase